MDQTFEQGLQQKHGSTLNKVYLFVSRPRRSKSDLIRDILKRHPELCQGIIVSNPLLDELEK
jgi:hypothetical protein